VADGRLRLPLTSKLVSSAKDVPLVILTRAEGDAERRKAFEGCGVELVDVEPDANGVMDMRDALEKLAGKGLTRVLVEGGARLAASLIQSRLVDRLEWFHAPTVLGGDAYPAIAALGLERVGDAPGFVHTHSMQLGADTLTSFAYRS
jgi:diaminohydroxyphosphoribosylaminopyrimidine deaminase/5-amino-6-(5-phosphoribosylamino)uracil reductase